MAFKKSVVSKNINDYSIMLVGQAGIGKTTVMKEALEKEFGEDGYVLFETADENGVAAIPNATYTDIKNWKDFAGTVKDICDNKNTEYKDLKVVVIDTIDNLLTSVAEPESIARYNRDNMGAKNFKPAKSILQAHGGFGKGENFAIELVWGEIRKLNAVGVSVWFIGHSRVKDITDPISNEIYSTMSSNMTQKYFNAFKDNIAIVAFAYADRNIEVEHTGRKNIVTHDEITRNVVKSETRKIAFRSDNYAVDTKSRFANIVDEIPLNADAFLNALHDAINSASSSNPTKTPVAEKAPAVENIEEEVSLTDEDIMLEDVPVVSNDSGDYPEDLIGTIRKMFKECADPDLKKQVKAKIAEYGKLTDVDDDGLKELYDLMK